MFHVEHSQNGKRLIQLGLGCTAGLWGSFGHGYESGLDSPAERLVGRTGQSRIPPQLR